MRRAGRSPRLLAQGLAVLIGLAAAVPVGAQASPDPPLTGRVMDRAGILSEETERTLTAQLAAHEEASTNQVVVLTIETLGGEAIEPLANRLFNAWRLGQAGRDNGVLLLVARDDRELRIEVGYGLEGALTDAAAGRIIRNVIVPSFRDGDYDGGVRAGVAAILGTIEGTYTPPDEGPSDEEVPVWFGLIFLVTHGLIPLFIAARGLVGPPAERYASFVFSLLFAVFGFGLVPAMLLERNGLLVGVLAMTLYALGFFAADLYMARSPKWKAIREKVRDARKRGTSTRIDAGWISFKAGGASSSGGGFSGGFSGGGGSSGGGGASGSW